MPSNTELMGTFWRMVSERQTMYVRRAAGHLPWTTDPILANNRFTNVYRVMDRVSQFLVKEVLYNNYWSQPDLVFRAILFRIFNEPNTWKALVAGLGDEPILKDFDPDRYADILTAHKAAGHTVFNNAYMMCGVKIYSDREKHRNWLYLLRHMLEDDLTGRILGSPSMREAFNALRQYQLVGDFLAMQWLTDINYSHAVNWSENDFVVAGPGAERGVAKLGFSNSSLVIRHLQAHQREYFDRFDLIFPYLGVLVAPGWNGPDHLLSLMDIQSCLCEFDKYCRDAYPDVVVGPTRIKQRFDPHQAHKPLEPLFLPPKWSVA